jgi:hypothetical protein
VNRRRRRVLAGRSLPASATNNPASVEGLAGIDLFSLHADGTPLVLTDSRRPRLGTPRATSWR